MKRKFYLLAPLALAAACLAAFIGLQVWQRGAANDARGELTDRAGDRGALAPFPLLIDISDYCQTQTVTVTGSAVDNHFAYGAPPRRTEAAAERWMNGSCFPVYDPAADNRVTPSERYEYETLLTTDRVELWASAWSDFDDLRFPLGMAIEHETADLMVRYRGPNDEPFFDGDNAPMTYILLTEQAGDGALWMVPILWPPLEDGYTGTVSLFRAAAPETDQFITDEDTHYPATPEERPTARGDVITLDSWPAGTRWPTELYAIGSDALLLSYDDQTFYITRYAPDGTVRSEYTRPLAEPDSRVSCTLYPDGNTLNIELHETFEDYANEEYRRTTVLLSFDTADGALTPLCALVQPDEGWNRLVCFREGRLLTVSTSTIIGDDITLYGRENAIVRPETTTCTMTVRTPSGGTLYKGDLITDMNDDSLYTGPSYYRRQITGVYLADRQTDKEGST